jgi:hypothetical protein
VSFQDRWNAAGQEAEVPDGNYDVEVIDASAFNRRSDGAEFAKLTLLVERGAYARQSFDHFMNLNNQVGLAIARDSLAMYGLDVASDVPSWTEFQNRIRSLVGVKANVTLIHKGAFSEVKVNTSQLPLTEQRSASPATPAAPTAPVAGDDDIPF